MDICIIRNCSKPHIMKKIYKLMALSMLVLGLAACKKEETPELTPDNIKITTTAVTDITAESAVTGGNISDAGGNTITKRGVCWGEAENPDIKGKSTNDGSGTGAFVSEISGLAPGKTYHVRAYAICQAGIAYGNDVSFSVPVFIPTVRTGVTSDLGIDYAVVSGEVLNKMGGTCKALVPDSSADGEVGQPLVGITASADTYRDKRVRVAVRINQLLASYDRCHSVQ